MTPEEAKIVIGNIPIKPEVLDDCYSITEYQEAKTMAIKALEQEDMLEKIRAKIEHLTYYWCEVNPKSVIDDVLQIIDKYKAESEDKG